jgi:hypothetical protein
MRLTTWAGAVRSWHVVTALAVTAATVAFATPAAAAGTRIPIGQWTLEAIPGVTTRVTALKDNAPVYQDSPLTAVDPVWHADAYLIGGEALGFNGSSSSAATTEPVLDTTTSFSVAAWVRPTDLSIDRDIFGQDNAAVADAARRGGFSVGIRREGRAARWSFGMGDGSSRRSPVVRATDSRALTADAIGRWTHIAASYDASTQTMSLYVNGAVMAQVQRTAVPWAATGPFTIGRSDNGGPANFWKGEVIRAKAYDRVLTSTDLFGGVIDGFTEPGMLDAVKIGQWTFGSATPCYVEVSGTCEAPDGAVFGRTISLTLGTDLAADRMALAFDNAAYVFDADFNQVFNPDGTPATQPSTEYGYLDNQVVHTNDAFSVSAVARVNDPGLAGPQTVVSIGATGGQPAFSIVYANGAYTASLAGTSPRGGSTTVSVPVADPAVWHELIAVYDPHQRQLRLYVDNTPPVSATVRSARDAGGRFEVGRSTAGSGYFYGAVDSLSLWQGALTDRQIAERPVWWHSD